ncbi:hypothetical protein R6Q57_021422 [Mikania cordata]
MDLDGLIRFGIKRSLTSPLQHELELRIADQDPSLKIQSNSFDSDDKLLARLNASRSSVSGIESGSGFGFEMKKMKRGMLKRVKSLSLSSTSSGGGSMMEWESVTESESKGSSGFSLLVYAWKSLLMMMVTGKQLRSCKQISDQKSFSWV